MCAEAYCKEEPTSQLMLVHTQEGPGGPEQRTLKVFWKYVSGQGQEAMDRKQPFLAVKHITTVPPSQVH